MSALPHLSMALIGRFVDTVTRPGFLALCFLLFGPPTGLGCALLAPVGMFPDEFAPAARADGRGHGKVLREQLRFACHYFPFFSHARTLTMSLSLALDDRPAGARRRLHVLGLTAISRTR